jgi:hypothetical protein
MPYVFAGIVEAGAGIVEVVELLDIVSKFDEFDAQRMVCVALQPTTNARLDGLVANEFGLAKNGKFKVSRFACNSPSSPRKAWTINS